MYSQNYGLRKMWLDRYLKIRVLRAPFEKQHAKWAQTLWKS